MEEPEHRAQQEGVEQGAKRHKRRRGVLPPETGARGLILHVAKGMTKGTSQIIATPFIFSDVLFMPFLYRRTE
jgi:hypothetical protein